jgi:ABC-type tungstate transport system substrate-binding protein
MVIRANMVIRVIRVGNVRVIGVRLAWVMRLITFRLRVNTISRINTVSRATRVSVGLVVSIGL